MALENEEVYKTVSLFFPMLITTLWRIAVPRRLSLVGLFSIGLLLIAIAIIRLPIRARSTIQLNRNTWGSAEEFAAALVANIPTLFSLRRRPVIDNSLSHNTYYSNRIGSTQVLEEGSLSLIVLDSVPEGRKLERTRLMWWELAWVWSQS
jgi:hypothetical protein